MRVRRVRLVRKNQEEATTYGWFFQVGMGSYRPKPQFSTIFKKWHSNDILIADLCPKLHLISSTFPRCGLHLLVASRYSDSIPLYKRM